MMDQVERMEAAAESAFDAAMVTSGKIRCPQCDEPFLFEEEGGPISANPYALPVCGKCLSEFICRASKAPVAVPL
jgi:hypothetical protein